MAYISKRGNKWQARISKRTEDKLIQKSKTFHTKKEAEIWARKIEYEVDSGAELQVSEVSFADYLDHWYTTYKMNTVSDKTKHNYELSIKHVKNYFGHTKLNKLTETMYQQFINYLAFGVNDKGETVGVTRSKETVDKVNIHCKSALSKAVKLGYIRFNPAEDIKSVGTIKQRDDDAMALSVEETKLLLNNLYHEYDPGNPDIVKMFNATSLSYGPRFSEHAGLTWDCVDFENGKIKLNKTWDFTRNRFGDMKNASSIRTVAINSKTMSTLQDIKHWQDNNNINVHNLVFIGPHKSLYSNTAINNSLRAAIKECGINKPNISHHNLRHTHITMLLYQNHSLKYVSRRAGHATVTTTIETYTHVLNEIEKSEDANVMAFLDNL